MTTGDKIFIFPETNKNAYVGMIHAAGFHCSVHHDFIEVGSPLHGHMERQEIAKAIKKARKAKGMKREELAKKLGANIMTVFNWETGATIPNKTNREKLNNIFEMEVMANGKI